MRLAPLLMLSVAASCAGAPAGPDPVPVTLVAVPSEETRAAAAGWQDGRPWSSQHEDICELGREEGLDLVFLGDSITQSWGGDGRRVWGPAGELWDERFGSLRAGNFGISGDRTQHVLWRLRNGALDGIQPRTVVLMIGTNNLPHDTPEDIALGIEGIVSELRERLPEADLIVHGIAPRGETPEDPMRRASRRVNELVRARLTGDRVIWLDLYPWFVLQGERANPELYAADFLHFSVEGYRAWANALETHYFGRRNQ